MKGKICFAAGLSALALAVFAPPVARVMALPERIRVPEGYHAAFAAGSKPVGGNIETGADGGQRIELSVFGKPVKTVRLERAAETPVVPCGVTAGVRFETEGVMVLGNGSVTDEKGETRRPCEGILKPGDVIEEADGKPLQNKEQLMAMVRKTNVGDKIQLKIRRDGVTRKAAVAPVLSKEDGEPKLGVWLRDSTQGIGTVTYYNPETKAFGALGHGILDVDTKRLLPVKSGQLTATDIISARKGAKGAPGELIGGAKRGAVIGDIALNTPFGLYGTMRPNALTQGEALPIGLQATAHEGPARIRANVSGTETKWYDVFIESVSKYKGDEAKGMVVRVTDPELIARTGGIVQGMSGSPIVQDGHVIGAVTHVFVQNPLKGYGIFIENMLKQTAGQK